MTNTIQVCKNYKYRLYRCDKKDALRRRSVRHLREKLFVVSLIWNHFIALQKRCYRLTGKYISLHEMNKHVLKLRRRVRFARWKHLHSQSCQDVCRRIDAGYQRFFDKLAAHPPKFRKAKKYRSFTFPQSGYKVEGNTISIDGRKYRFVRHREIGEQVKTLTVMRDAVGRLWLVFSVVENMVVSETSTGKSGGFDFGLKTFLTDDAGRAHSSPLFYACTLAKTRECLVQLARFGKCAGSKRYKRARRALARQSAHVADARREHHFKLAHQLCREYDTLCLEDLNLAGMKALWGRKVSDLGFANFVTILKWVALKHGKQVIQINRFTPTTQVCSGCDRPHALTLRERVLSCACGLVIGREGFADLTVHNAAINILRAGTSAPYRSDRQTPGNLRSRT